MLKHIVMFRFKGDEAERKQTAIEFSESLIPLVGIIDALKSIEVGINENPAEQFDLVLTAVVDSIDTLPLYAEHPDHLAAVARVKARIDRRACVDYTV